MPPPEDSAVTGSAAGTVPDTAHGAVPDAASGAASGAGAGAGAQPGSTGRPGGPSQDELLPLDPRARTLWWVTGGLVALQVGLVAALVDFLAPLPLRPGVLSGAVFAVAALGAAVIPVLRYRRWRYALRPDDLWIRHGVLWVTVSVIPFSRLQFVDTRQGPLDRLFGLSQLVVHTAALGTSGRLPGLDAREAVRLRERLAEVEPSDDASV
ncbi:MAG TPA: PH domain-containing protein [Egibacteraceae bacterium]|nr:PH domain-containing protein [Egibacteraceae bacterium]